MLLLLWPRVNYRVLLPERLYIHSRGKIVELLRFIDVSNLTKIKQFAQRMRSRTAVPPFSDEDPNQLLLLKNHGFYLFASFPAPESWLWCSFSERASLMAAL